MWGPDLRRLMLVWIILNTEHKMVDLLCGLLLPHHHLQVLLFSASGLSLLLQQLFPGIFLIVWEFLLLRDIFLKRVFHVRRLSSCSLTLSAGSEAHPLLVSSSACVSRRWFEASLWAAVLIQHCLMAVGSFDSQTLFKLVAFLLPVLDSFLQLSHTCTWSVICSIAFASFFYNFQIINVPFDLLSWYFTEQGERSVLKTWIKIPLKSLHHLKMLQQNPPMRLVDVGIKDFLRHCIHGHAELMHVITVSASSGQFVSSQTSGWDGKDSMPGWSCLLPKADVTNYLLIRWC